MDNQKLVEVLQTISQRIDDIEYYLKLSTTFHPHECLLDEYDFPGDLLEYTTK